MYVSPINMSQPMLQFGDNLVAGVGCSEAKNLLYGVVWPL